MSLYFNLVYEDHESCPSTYEVSTLSPNPVYFLNVFRKWIIISDFLLIFWWGLIKALLKEDVTDSIARVQYEVLDALFAQCKCWKVLLTLFHMFFDNFYVYVNNNSFTVLF